MKQPTLLNLLMAMCVALLASRGSAVFAQQDEREAAIEREVTALVLPGVTTGRSSAPLPVQIELTSSRSDMLQGRLVLRAREGMEQPFIWQSEELVLSPGKTVMRAMLPALGQAYAMDVVQAELSFVTPQGVLSLGRHPLPLFADRARTLTVLLAHPTGSRSISALTQSLALERYRPIREDRDISTFTSRDQPEALPTTPVGYLPYDVVVLVDAGLNWLDQRQLDALLAWVRAGGGLLVAPGRGLESRHIEFLNALVGEPRYTVVALDAPGEGGVMVAAGDAPTDGVDLLSPGFGRAAVAVDLRPHENVDILETPQWRRVVAHLWQLRRDHRQALVTTGQWDHASLVTSDRTTEALNPYRAWGTVGPAENEPPTDPAEVDVSYTHTSLRVGQWVTQLLMPKDARFIPMSVIWMMLAGLVLLIGPAEYLLLSLFKARRWTWVTFPLVVVLFSVLLVEAARRSVGEATTSRSLHIRDVDASGSTLRQTTLQLWFAGGSINQPFALRDGTFVAMDRTTMDQWYGQPTQSDSAGPTLYAGNLLEPHMAVQPLVRWTPQLDRITQLGAAIDAGAASEDLDADAQEAESVAGDADPIAEQINWSALENFSAEDAGWMAAQDDPDAAVAIGPGEYAVTGVATATRISQLRQELLGDRLPEAQVVVLRSESATTAGEPSTTSSLQHAMQESLAQMQYYYYYAEDDPLRAERALPQFVHLLSVRPGTGFFGLLARISPGGGRALEDLAILDPTNSDEYAVVVIVPQGDSYIVYRRLVRQGGP